jgi:hypothetical protein
MSLRPLLALLLAAGCGAPCPDGYVVDEANKECNPASSGEGEADADTDADADADADSDADADADSDADTDADTDADADADGLPAGAYDGGLDTTDGRVEAELEAWAAFSFAGTVSGREVLLVYMSSTPDADCGLVADHLGAVEGPIDPSPLFTPNTCNLVLKIEEPPAEVSASSPLPVSAARGVVVSAACAAGPGSFVRMTISGQDGYFWQDSDAADAVEAPWYTAYADAGEITRLEVSGAAVTLDLELDSFTGSYPLETGTSLARGSGAGTITATACPALAETPFYTGG